MGKRRPDLREKAVQLRLNECLSNKEIWEALDKQVAKITVAGWVRKHPLTDDERRAKFRRVVDAGRCSRPKTPKHSCFRPICKRRVAKTRNKYCSSNCAIEHKHERYISRWFEGKETGSKPSSPDVISGRVRRYLFQKNNDSCEECSWSKRHSVTGKIPLQVDHIDGNSRNSVPENLRLLCPNCHSLTETFGSLNKGNGRWVRRREPVNKE